jgi:RNA polymerase sigma-70 factor (ECF subfamily)
VLSTVSRIDLERAIEALPPACRAAFLLHDVEGFGHQEVAEILGVSEGTSKSQVHKARLRIRAHLGARELRAG